jgi:putative hydrolase of HD superfamily
MENFTELRLQKIIKFLEITGILKRISRAGWVDAGIYQPESVADHTLRTTILCMLYADINCLDTLKLIRMALIHDLPETLIGDLMPSQKSERTKENEEYTLQQIFSLLPVMQKENYLAVWNEYKLGRTKEAKAVHQIDKIEMALQAKEYEKFGATAQKLERFIDSAREVTKWPDLNRLLSCILEEKYYES